MKLKKDQVTGDSVNDPARRSKMLNAGKQARKKVLIKNTKLKQESWVVASAAKVWLDRGWTLVDDGKSETATRGASKKEKN